MEEMEIAINATTSDVVKIWMNWMIIVFLSSIFFTYKQVSARFIFISFFISFVVAILIFNMTRSPYLVGVSHIIVWAPLAIYLLKKEIIGEIDNLKSVYAVYLLLLLATIIISLFFDIRDTALISLGMKDPFI